jgi:hypothetical protein
MTNLAALLQNRRDVFRKRNLPLRGDGSRRKDKPERDKRPEYL